MIKYNISLFDNIRQKNPKNFEGSVDELRRGLLTAVSNGEKAKLDLPLWSPTTFNGSRSMAHAVSISCLVFDIDDGLTNIETWRLFAQSGMTVFAHSSMSHSITTPKYRLILPLYEPIKAEDWEKGWRAGLRLWNDVVGVGEPDLKALKDIARVYFRFAYPMSDITDKSHFMSPYNLLQTYYFIGAPLSLYYKDIKLPKKEDKKWTPPAKDAPRKYNDLLREYSVRQKIAYQSGGVIMGSYVHKINCPQCGEQSVYFTIDLNVPNSTFWATCTRKNKCSWYGSIEDLL